MTPKTNYFHSICNVSRAFGTKSELGEILDLVVASAVDTMKVKAASLFLFDEEKDLFLTAAQKGLSKNYLHAKPVHARKLVKDILKKGYMVVADATKDSRIENPAAKKKEGIVSLLVLPVLVSGKTIGVLSLYTASPREFTEDEIAFASALAEQGGMAIEHARLVKRIRDNIRIFLDLATNINSSLELKTILQTLTEDIAKEIGVKAASIRLLNDDRTSLQLAASYGLSENYLSKGPISAEKSIAEALKGKPVIVKNASTDKGVQYKKEKKAEGIVSILCVPISVKGDVIGVLRLYSAVERVFSDDEIMLVTAIASQGGLAIQNAGLYLMLQRDVKDLKDNIWSHKSWF
jgi:GAF domain-containing protein